MNARDFFAWNTGLSFGCVCWAISTEGLPSVLFCAGATALGFCAWVAAKRDDERNTKDDQ